jgi:hypothetical protein
MLFPLLLAHQVLPLFPLLLFPMLQALLLFLLLLQALLLFPLLQAHQALLPPLHPSLV